MMKKTLCTLMAMTATLAAQAGDYGYLTIETADGAKTSVALAESADLALNFGSTTLTVGEQTFELTALSRMYFSTADETTATGISEIMTADADETAEYYDLQGRRVTREQMRKGIYVVKTKTRTYKVNVR